MKYLILVLLIFQNVDATSKLRNTYCSKDRGEELKAFGDGKGIIYCTHQEIQKGGQFRLEGQTSSDIYFMFAELIDVTGDLHETSMDLFPFVWLMLIYQSNITEFSLKSDIFELTVKNSVFPKVTSELLKGCKKIILLSFISNPGLEFEEGAFRNLKKLNNLALINQSIPRLQKGLLEGIVRLEALALNLNNLSVVDEDAFLDHVHLLEINLDDNPMEYFKANISGLTKLESLSLVNTKLKVISVDMNAKRNQLDRLYLPTTYLLNTNSSVMLAMFPKLHHLGITSEDFECPTVKPVLQQLKLDGLEVYAVRSSYLRELVRPSVC